MSHHFPEPRHSIRVRAAAWATAVVLGVLFYAGCIALGLWLVVHSIDAAVLEVLP